MTFVVSDGPRIEHRDEAPTVGIRLVTPFRGMLGVRDELLSGSITNREATPPTRP